MNEFIQEFKTNALNAWRCFSMHAVFILGAIPVAWSQMPDDLKVGNKWAPWIIWTATTALVYIARAVPQAGKTVLSTLSTTTVTASEGEGGNQG